jgi:hypothetical protein
MNEIGTLIERGIIYSFEVIDDDEDFGENDDDGGVAASFVINFGLT